MTVFNRSSPLKRSLLVAILVCAFLPPAADAQSRAGLRQFSRPNSPLLYYETGPAQLIETFSLMQQANAGVLAAQHELGFRYLYGRGLPADTARAAEWIFKAAKRGMPLAQYNAGILAMHGIGVSWNPFEAFTWFELASAQDHPAAQFILGLLYTDGLAVKRDMAQAYQLVRRSSESGYEPAKEILAEFIRRGIDTTIVASKKSTAKADTAKSLVYLNFEGVTKSDVGDTTLVRELTREVPSDAFQRSTITPVSQTDTAAVQWLETEADRGIPEAHVVLGRIYEKGIGVKADTIRAAMHYLRANRLDSPRGPVLLADLVQHEGFRRLMTERSLSGDHDARYIWAGLAGIEFEAVIGPGQALKLLEENVNATPAHVNSLLEIGVWYATGRNVQQSSEKALEYWRRAAAAGLHEAEIRIALAEILLGRGNAETNAALLKDEAEKGSIIAQSGAGYCLERGVGSAPDKSGAVNMYRRAAQRGSVSSYLALRRMYDEVRPSDQKFRVE